MKQSQSYSARFGGSYRELLFIVLFFCPALFAQSSEPNTAVRPPAATKTEAATPVDTASKNDALRTLKVGGGDLLDIKVFGVPELSDSVRISARGDVSLPLVGTVHLDGLTAEQSEKLIEQKLKEGGFLRDPHVSVFVKEYATAGISVMGEVARPGYYALIGARRLFDALSLAGGTTTKAGKIVSIAHRDTPNDPQLITLSNDPTKSSLSNVEINPGDTIVVSKAGIVYVVGEVTKPSGFVMENNESLTVLQALALAEGLGRSAAPNGAKIIRKTPTGLEEILVPLKKILEGKSPDVAMRGEDVLFVPASAGKNAARRTLEAVVQTATGLAVYRR
ncbi:MAG: polysaccharide export protein [Acidobacteriales bacterium]|nr:polysaccharide export protein [Terriglobales bacterium]